jgi:hypothetical protein
MNKSVSSDKLWVRETLYQSAEPSRISSYFVLDEDVVLVPVDDFCCDLESLEDPNEPSEPNIAGS